MEEDTGTEGMVVDTEGMVVDTEGMVVDTEGMVVVATEGMVVVATEDMVAVDMEEVIKEAAPMAAVVQITEEAAKGAALMLARLSKLKLTPNVAFCIYSWHVS